MAYLRKVNKQLRVNKQLTMSKILNFHSRHLCLEQFQRLELLLTRFQEEEKVPLIDLRAPPQVKRRNEDKSINFTITRLDFETLCMPGQILTFLISSQDDRTWRVVIVNKTAILFLDGISAYFKFQNSKNTQGTSTLLGVQGCPRTGLGGMVG